ncbi:MAG: hypothetical protein OEM26_05620 [Saprospiraceae bacterium]|nr:hypothetical protein [Saprospiraceae bacterium]
MKVEDVLNDKTQKAKAKVKQIGQGLIDGAISLNIFLNVTEGQRGTNRATCIEALEFATRENPDIASKELLHFATQALQEEEPRTKWESAKVIGNIATKFPTHLDTAIASLLDNARHSGTVVRWASALALGEILKLQGKEDKDLIEKIEGLSAKEEDEGVKKKYLDALKKVKK